MAKKQQAEQAVESVEQTIEVTQTKNTKQSSKSDLWESKDRTYYLLGDRTPLTFTLASRHTSRFPLLWFDEEAGYSKELRYATNQKSPILEEQKGHVTLEHVVFRDGTLFVPKTNPALQKLLSLYHPQLNKTYAEVDMVKDANEELSIIELEIEALKMASELDLDHAEAVLRVERGDSVSRMTTAELKRDLYVLAQSDPELFLELANDEDVKLRNNVAKAIERKIILLSPDKRTFTLASNKEKILTVPFEESPLSAMASYLKTDKGLDLYSLIEKKIK